jgi:hypothetical protein
MPKPAYEVRLHLHNLLYHLLAPAPQVIIFLKQTIPFRPYT